jgi:hypothetical protein
MDSMGYGSPWLGNFRTPEGCHIVAGGRNVVQTSGTRPNMPRHPAGVPELPRIAIRPALKDLGKSCG